MKICLVYVLCSVIFMIRIKAWNTRGIMYGTPYLSELLNESDIFVATEHWLLPEQLKFLNSIHTDFNVYGLYDKRIPTELENRTRSTGFGGIALFWRKHIQTFPIEHECTDRVIIALTRIENIEIYVIGVLLPSTNISIDEYKQTVEWVEKLFDEYSEIGPVFIMGDFNAHLSKHFGAKNHSRANERGLVIESFIAERDLISITSQLESCGPDYTFLSHNGTLSSTIDHVIIQRNKEDFVHSCGIIDDHHLNCSDHLPVYINVSFPKHISRCGHVNLQNKEDFRVNWKRVTTDHVLSYRQRIKDGIEQLKPSLTGHSQKEVEGYIHDLTVIILDAAKQTLPRKKFRSYLKPYWKYGDVKKIASDQ